MTAHRNGLKPLPGGGPGAVHQQSAYTNPASGRSCREPPAAAPRYPPRAVRRAEATSTPERWRPGRTRRPATLEHVELARLAHAMADLRTMSARSAGCGTMQTGRRSGEQASGFPTEGNLLRGSPPETAREVVKLSPPVMSRTASAARRRARDSTRPRCADTRMFQDSGTIDAPRVIAASHARWRPMEVPVPPKSNTVTSSPGRLTATHALPTFPMPTRPDSLSNAAPKRQRCARRPELMAVVLNSCNDLGLCHRVFNARPKPYWPSGVTRRCSPQAHAFHPWLQARSTRAKSAGETDTKDDVSGLNQYS